MAAKGCRSKNVSMFFSNSIANRKGFLPCLSPFRAWTGEGEAGTWQSDAIRNITGRPGITASDEFTWGEGAFYGVEYFAGVLSTAQPSHLIYFDSSRVIPTGPVTVPPHIWQPVVVYLGLPA